MPDASSLLAGYPDATLRLEHSVGPAEGPASADASASPGASPAPVEVGRVKFAGPFVIGVACLGDGQILVQLTSPDADFPYTQAPAPCDGTPVHAEYLAEPFDPASSGDVVTVTVSPGTSWRLAIGEYPAALLTPPSFEPIELTDGWSLVSNGQATLSSTNGGARVTMPDDATRAGVLVQCQGAGPVSITVDGSPATAVDCGPSGTTRRLEFPAVGGEPLSVQATMNGNRVWLRMIIEADAGLGSTYPSAPPMPATVAAAPYVAPDASVVGFGRLGSDRQTILPIEGARPGRPAGDLLPVAVSSESVGARLDLVSVSGGEVLRTLTTIPAPAFIFDSWADATHEHVYYGVADDTGVGFHRVAVDGTGDQIVASVEDGSSGFTADLALDESVFIVDACFEGRGCARTVVDTATGTARTVDREGASLCEIFGIVDGTIFGSTRSVCAADSATDLIAVTVDGGEPTMLAPNVARSSLSGAFVVPTSVGPKLVLGGLAGPDDMPWDVLDVATGKTSILSVGAVPLGPADLRLPGGWILLTGGMMGDFPWQKAFDRPVPILVNLVTGERIELVNLPHWTGNY